MGSCPYFPTRNALQVIVMARLAAALAFLSLLVTVALAAVVVAPDRLPPQLSALAAGRQPRVTAEQMQSVIARLDRIGGELEKLRQVQQEQGKAIASANQASGQNAQLQQAIASVRQDVATLRQDVESLRAAPSSARGGSRPARR
jgi:hypothetical protein